MYEVELPYLEKNEKCNYDSYEWNDAQTPDFWIFKNYTIHLTDQGLFNLYDNKLFSNGQPKNYCIKTFDSLKEAILYIKSLKQNQK